MIASHIDRPSFSIISQLGFIPRDLELDAVEISRAHKGKVELKDLSGPIDVPQVTFSDAHTINDIGKAHASFLLENPDINEIRMAFRSESGRGVVVR
jgi:hypothetical protein